MKITIQAIESRRQSVERMLDSLGSGADVEVHWDTQLTGHLNSFIHMLIEYLPYIESDMEKNGYDVLSLFAPRRKQLQEYYGDGIKYAHFARFLWLQATVFSEKAVEEMKTFYKEQTELGEVLGAGKHDDVFVQEYLRHYNKKAYCHLPSVVQHNVHIGSSIGHSGSALRMSNMYDRNYIDKFLEGR